MSFFGLVTPDAQTFIEFSTCATFMSSNDSRMNTSAIIVVEFDVLDFQTQMLTDKGLVVLSIWGKPGFYDHDDECGAAYSVIKEVNAKLRIKKAIFSGGMIVVCEKYWENL